MTDFPFSERYPAIPAPAGTVLFAEGQSCAGFPILEQGRVRVYKAFATGRELLLYRLEPGDACIVSIACLFSQAPYSLHAVAETAVSVRIVPAEAFRGALGDAGFRDFVLHQFAQRLSDLLMVIDAVVTHRVDQRLAACLVAHGPDCRLSHQQLADELGSVREIVTRVLRRFADEGWVTPERGHVHILDAEALRRHSSESAS